ncbi:hypothetical protein BJ165DRAFT_861524 [Panaeolus papilionaceus]|nr:hypothetical protein BJ165DRAFT_861524 [Panaeolus papilionaceus]
MWFFTGLALLGSLRLALAQEDICLTNLKYRWTYNAQGASPCVVAGALLSVCLNEPTNIRKLDPGERYPGAQASGEGAACRCSTVYYSMLSACAYCQDRGWITWPAQIEHCADTFSQMLPMTVPGNTTIPPWAWADVVSQGAFDIAIAQTISTTPPPGPTATPSDTSSSTSNASSSSSSISSTSTASTSKDTPVGPIVGGVIGGLAVLGIVAVVVAWIVTRSRRNAAAVGHTTAPSSIAPTSPPMTAVGYNITTSLPTFPAGPSVGAMPKLYDPNDPSTFPMMMDQSPPGVKASPGTTSVAVSTGTPPTTTITPNLSPQTSPLLPSAQSPAKLTPNRKPTVS